MSDVEYTVYGYRLSYATRTAELCLRWHRQPYGLQSLTWERRKALLPQEGVRSPVVVEGPHQQRLCSVLALADSLRTDQHDLQGEGPSAVLLRLLTMWCNDWLWRMALSLRWNEDYDSGLACDALAREHVPEAPPILLAAVKSFVGDWAIRALRAWGCVSPEQQREIEHSFTLLCDAMQRQLSLTPCLLGTSPCLIDMMLLGALRSHFAVDPKTRRVLTERPQLLTWLDAASDMELWPRQRFHLETPSPFARFILDHAQDYVRFLQANGAAVAKQAPVFTLQMAGEAVCFGVQADADHEWQQCRAMAQQLTPPEQAQLAHWLDASAMADLLAAT